MRPVHTVNQTAKLNLQPYKETKNFGIPKGLSEDSQERLKQGKAYESLVNKLHIIKLANNFPANEVDVATDYRRRPLTAVDLCEFPNDTVLGNQQYEVEDFIYCKNYGLPINRMITLRRFPNPVTDNIYDRFNQAEPDIARLVTYSTQETNKREELMSMSFGMKWKQLTAEMEQASAIGDQSGFSGIAKKVMQVVDPQLHNDQLKGSNRLNYDPKHDSNKVYGPVDSITETHIRDVGFEMTKDFDLVFEYDLQSWGGRTPEFAMRDIIANVLAVTYNNGKFWPGSRYWVGERPSMFMDKFRKLLSPDDLDQWFEGGWGELKSAVQGFMKNKGSAIAALKNAMMGGLAMGISKLLDAVGRPSIVVMNSLLSGEPTGFWHLTVGNPVNPDMVMGNLICTGVEVKFPTDTLSYLDFPTKLLVSIKLKPGMPKDKAGIEMMFNMGKQRIYHNPLTITKTASMKATRNYRNIGLRGDADEGIRRTIEDAFDFVADNAVSIVTEGGQAFNEHSGDAIKSSGQVIGRAYDALTAKYESTRNNSILR